MANHDSNYTRRLEVLLEICRNLSANLELEPLLYALIEAASELTQSESSSILVYDQERHYLRFAAAPFYQMDQLHTIGVPLENSIAGWVFKNKEAVILHEADKDNRLFKVADRETAIQTRSIAAVPLSFRGKAIGVFESINKVEGLKYNEADIFILETLASQAAFAIQNQVIVEEKQAAYHKAMEVDRMKSDFIAIASHELRTPLGLILGHGSFLYDTASDEQKQDIDTILKSATRLKEIIEDFSNVEKLEIGLTRLRRGEVQLSNLIRETVNSFRDLSQDYKVYMEIDLADENILIEGDSEKIAIALRNLIENAILFNKPGGRVNIKADMIPGYIKLVVSDTGVGIPETDLDKIFQRFYQVEKHLIRKHNGMGLGLSIARDMINMHGGKINVESRESLGSIFTILLPNNQAQADAAQKVFLNP